MAKYFGTNGVRGKFDELTPELSYKICAAIGLYFNCGTILIARDARLTGPAITHSAISALSSVGCNVIDLGVCSSPTAEFMVEHLKADGCIIITASHNPPEWNAIKVVDGKGIAISSKRGEEIESLMSKQKLTSWDMVGKISHHELAAKEHINAILGQVDKTKTNGKKIVIDCANGTAALVAPKLFASLGCEVITINGQIDGRFPGRPSEPTETNVKTLIDTVISTSANAGIAWDGDGDRVIFVDEEGKYIIGDLVFALCLMWKLSKSKGDVVTTVATSKAAYDVAKSFGSKVRYTAIGAPYLCEEMVRSKAAMGGEEVGGVIWPEFSLAKDGFLTAAKMVEAIDQKPLSKWLSGVPKYYNVKLKIEANASAKQKLVDSVLAHAKKNKLSYTTVDGVRIDFPDSWVIVRASGTENYVRVFAEAKTLEKAKALSEEYVKIAKG
ncbi:MAG: phosphoglucosamine mutase [Candidatus Bilamarchaeum sp.]|jgi:phosphomannomutase/phosphoglucomutase